MPIRSADSEIQPYLLPGEKLLWSGFPGRGVRLRAQDAFTIPFSLACCGFAVFWTVMVTRSHVPFFFSLWGLMFVGIGLYVVFGRFFVDARRRGNAVYAVTDQRVLIAEGLFSRELRSLSIRAIPEVSLRLHRDGTGTVTFDSLPRPEFVNVRGWPLSERYNPPAFEFIETPEQVHSLILRQQNEASRPST